MLKNIYKSICCVVFTALSVISADEFEIDEDALFADTSMTVDSALIVDSSLSMAAPEKTTVGFSGEINSIGSLGVPRESFSGEFSRSQIMPAASIFGGFFLDARLPMNTKAFVNAETQYKSDSGKTYFRVPEFFLDVNFNKRLYIRTGKQVLQWGRCFFWNPTDLINVEKKSFNEKIESREGAYGVRLHAPFGTKYNLYGFIDMGKLTSVDSLAGSFKAEVLLGNVEIAAAIWGKQNKDPVFGLDFSTSFYKVDLSAELSLENSANYTSISFPYINDGESLLDYFNRRGASGIVEKKKSGSVVPKACVSLSRSFDLLDINDRVTVMTEFYYNNAGISGEFFKTFKVKKLLENLNSGVVSDAPRDSTFATAIGRLQNYLTDLNSFSTYYLALFTSVNKFIVSDMTLGLNSMINIDEKSAIISANLNYQTMHNLKIGLLISTAVGNEESIYPLFMDALTIRLNCGVMF
jgi:hypothetical protein